MRRTLAGAAIVVVLGGAACARTSDSATTTSSLDLQIPATTMTAAPSSPTTTTITAPPSSPTTTTLAPATVALQLHDAERVALRLGVALSVRVDGAEVAVLRDGSGPVTIEVTEPTEVEFVYVGSAGEPSDVSWRQQVAPGDAAVAVVQPWRELGGRPTDFVLAWQRRMTPAEAVAEIEGAPLTVVSPLWWNINDEALLTGGPDAAYVDVMHERGIQVWPAVQGLHAEGLHLMLNDEELRRSIVDELAGGSAAAGADGFNIDIEGFWDEDAEAFSVFVEELAAAVHAWGGVVSYDLVPRSDTWDVTPPDLAFWSTAPQRRRLAAAVDYTVLMAYDQHNRYRPAGPVAAPRWVEEMIIYQLRYSDPHTVILGLPAYGRLWDPEELDAPRALGFGAFADLAGERSFDPQFDMDRVELADGRFYWTDHEVTGDRRALGDDYGLSGVAVWRLGLDHPDFWTDLE